MIIGYVMREKLVFFVDGLDVNMSERRGVKFNLEGVINGVSGLFLDTFVFGCLWGCMILIFIFGYMIRYRSLGFWEDRNDE